MFKLKRGSAVTMIMVVMLAAAILLCSCQQTQSPEPKTTAANTNAGTAANASTNNTDSKAAVVEEVKEMLAKHDWALNEQNLDAVLQTFADDAKTVALGTGEGERFVGKENIRNAYTEIFKDYEKGSLVTDCEWKTGDVAQDGKTAWLAAGCQASDTLKGVKRQYFLNVSAAVVKQDAAGWRFVMLHMSNAQSGGPPPPPPKK
jgi:ketosteroid isomerase-like protein